MSDISEIDVAANRSARKWSRREQVGRILWIFVWPLFRLSPRPFFWGWRCFILRCFGARIGDNVHIHPTVRIAIPWNLSIADSAAVGDGVILYSLGPIRIDARATVSQGAHLCAGSHDWRHNNMPLTKPPIQIGADAWVCAEAFVGPGVRVGEGAIVGARAVVMKSVSAKSVMSGNPAVVIAQRTFNFEDTGSKEIDT